MRQWMSAHDTTVPEVVCPVDTFGPVPAAKGVEADWQVWEEVTRYHPLAGVHDMQVEKTAQQSEQWLSLQTWSTLAL